ncbi:MAG TPA: hypothetical protein ENK44_15415 [Caldithrix abyssi]|uniref:Uncharacterized protein n=1 Tax=Caldithrix abyssi TaxID=187145 RepID=A0A7V4UFF9_CALAY|nr:hypothetical protein [Caldithrix abyssi]
MVKFIKVGSNHLKNYDIVYIEKNCGGTCGSGIYFLLKKEKNVWKILEKKKFGQADQLAMGSVIISS